MTLGREIAVPRSRVAACTVLPLPEELSGERERVVEVWMPS